MKSLRKLGLTAVLALAAAAFVSTASASAFTKWQVDGGDVTSATNVSIASSSAGLTFSHSGFGISFTINCQMSGAGTVNSAGADTVTSIASTSCTGKSGTCPTPISVAGVNLPWTTQISGSRDATSNPGHNPGFAIHCASTVVPCTVTTFSQALSNGSGVVLGTFDASTPSLSCSDSGPLGISGTLVSSISGHSLQVA
jgi:hypothetical protein